ncbi:hemicentin-1, partial [Trichonephila clavata]
MTHVARGLDRRGKLLVDIVISGEVPDLPKESEVILHPFVEDYIQTGPALGEMPYLNEKLYANEMDSYYDPDKQELNFIISASIGKGSSSDECLDGFTLSSNGIYLL